MLGLATRLDWPRVLAALAQASSPLLVLAMSLTLVSLLIRTWRWRLLLGQQAPRAGPLLSTYVVGVAAGLLVPASGELARAGLLAHRGGLRTSFLLGAAALEKLLDGVVVVALFVVGLSYTIGLSWGFAVLGRALVVLGIAVGALVLATRLAPRRDAPVAAGPAPPWTAAAVRLTGVWAGFAQGAGAVARLPRTTQLAILGLTLLSWCCACLVTVCTLAAFALPTDWALAAVLYAALLLGLSVPSAPGAVGTFEVVVVAVLDAFGLPGPRAAAFALGFHAVTFAPLLLAGALAWGLSRPSAPPPPPGPSTSAPTDAR